MDLLQTLSSNVWAVFLVVLFFGGSIFVHELGHFLAARWRGMHVERFSIGFGPRIFSWRGKDGVEYCVSWLPLGGYVALPQLAEMRAIEGDSSTDLAKLPPPSYTTKVIVSVAGAVFNVIFAFLLASIIWFVGQEMPVEAQTNRLGVVLPEIELASGKMAPGPAFAAGLKPGDLVTAVDGKSVTSLSDIQTLIMLGSGRGTNGEPKVSLTVLRDTGETHIDVFPAYVSQEKIRDIGVDLAGTVAINTVQEDSAAMLAGLKPGDIITHLDDQPVGYVGYVQRYLRSTQGAPVRVSLRRNGVAQTVLVSPHKMIDPETQKAVFRIGVVLEVSIPTRSVHVAPWTQIEQHAIGFWRTLQSLLSPKSDIGLSKMSGPIGIAKGLHSLAKLDFRLVLWFTVLINVNLAILNLLPVPVLDGGHILFATIGKLRGRALPVDFIATIQSVFIVLLFSMVIYVSVFDVRRIVRDTRDEKPAKAAPAATPPAAPVAPAPAAP
jgi:regulator of sigma E protease